MDMISEREALCLAANYRLSCLLTDREYTDEDCTELIQQFAHSRYVGGLFMSCLSGEALISMQDAELRFQYVDGQISEKLKEEYEKILEKSMED
jgi:hypothetical protein